MTNDNVEKVPVNLVYDLSIFLAEKRFFFFKLSAWLVFITYSQRTNKLKKWYVDKKRQKRIGKKRVVVGKSVGHGSVAATAPALGHDKDPDSAWLKIRFGSSLYLNKYRELCDLYKNPGKSDPSPTRAF